MSKKKGQKNERRARDIYESVGYETFSPQHTWHGRQDIFNLFDVLAVKPGEHTVLAQVKTNGASGIRAFMEDAREFECDHTAVHFLARHDGDGHGGGGWRLMVPAGDAGGVYTCVLDERDCDENIGVPLERHLREL